MKAVGDRYVIAVYACNYSTQEAEASMKPDWNSETSASLPQDTNQKAAGGLVSPLSKPSITAGLEAHL